MKKLKHSETLLPSTEFDEIEAVVRVRVLDTAEAFVEFGELQAKLELESDLRTHAEEFAAQVSDGMNGTMCSSLCDLSDVVMCLFVFLVVC